MMIVDNNLSEFEKIKGITCAEYLILLDLKMKEIKSKENG